MYAGADLDSSPELVGSNGALDHGVGAGYGMGGAGTEGGGREYRKLDP